MKEGIVAKNSNKWRGLLIRKVVLGPDSITKKHEALYFMVLDAKSSECIFRWRWKDAVLYLE